MLMRLVRQFLRHCRTLPIRLALPSRSALGYRSVQIAQLRPKGAWPGKPGSIGARSPKASWLPMPFNRGYRAGFRRMG